MSMMAYNCIMKLAKDWHKILSEEIAKPYISDLKSFLQSEKEQHQKIYPPEEMVFNAFSYTPYEKVKVVIMGQDPYHGDRQAQGLSFSVPLGMRQPPSLQNIYKELKTDLGISPPEHGSLLHWANEGVLMLNATLTVRAGQPKSHFGRGWERFTDAVVRKLTERKTPLVFILWGKSAKDKCEAILNNMKHPHLVLTSAHPSPFSAHMFYGCRHFSKANNFLKANEIAPIDWKIP